MKEVNKTTTGAPDARPMMKDELAIEHVILNLMPWTKRSGSEGPDPVLLLTREWLVTNGLGGYASASVSGACTRRYHGLLIAALPAPLGRMVMLSHFGEEIAFAHTMVELDKLLSLFHDKNRMLPGLSIERIWFLHSLRGPERMLQTRAVLGMLTAELAACTSA